MVKRGRGCSAGIPAGRGDAKVGAGPDYYREEARPSIFSGSAEPNPGGRMGAGWRLVFTDRPEETGSSEWPAARDNTNNRAEYLALIGALEQYLASGRPGPLQVLGDSQLVINQMTGDWGINNPALWQLNRQATALVKRIAGGVRYRWIPREENQVADTLAGGQLALAGTPLVYAEHPGGAAVAAALAEQIATPQPGGQDEFQGGAGAARRGDGSVFALAPAGAGDGRRSRGCGADRCRLSRPERGGHQSAGDGAAVDGAGARQRSWPSARSRSTWRCRRTGDRTERRERCGRASAIVRKGATLVETSGARASPLPFTRAGLVPCWRKRARQCWGRWATLRQRGRRQRAMYESRNQRVGCLYSRSSPVRWLGGHPHQSGNR